MQKYSNDGIATLSAPLLDTDLEMTLDTGLGDNFQVIASPDFELIKIISGDSFEIVKVTERTLGSDTLDIERAQESTTALTVAAGSTVKSTLTAGTIANLLDSRNDLVQAGEDAVAQSAKAISIGYQAANPLLGVTPPSRAISTPYAAGEIIITGGIWWLECMIAGTSSAGSYSIAGTGSYVLDGTVVWREIGSLGSEVSIGESAWARYGVALGKNAFGFGLQLGEQAYANLKSIAKGYRAKCLSKNSMAMGSNSIEYETEYALASDSLMPIVQHVFDWDFGSENRYKNNLIGAISSEPIDLAGGKLWSASLVTNHAEIIRPTVGNGCQFIYFDENMQMKNDPKNLSYTAAAIEATEPTWTTGQEDFIGTSDPQKYFVCIRNDGSYVMGLSTDMLIEEVYFICHKASTVTVQPNISIGITGDLTKLINNQAATGLTADKTVMKWTPTNPVIMSEIAITIDTLATADQMLGHFLFKGFYVKHAGF